MPGMSLADPDDEQKLVVLLRAFLARTGKKGTVIFDNGQPGGADDWSNNVLKVRFAAAASSADASILNRLAANEDGRGLVLVSDDQRLVAAAQRTGATVRSSREFGRELVRGPASGDKKPEVQSRAEVAEWEKLFKQRKK